MDREEQNGIDHDDEENENDKSDLEICGVCATCGAPAAFKCSACQVATYCSGIALDPGLNQTPLRLLAEKEPCIPETFPLFRPPSPPVREVD